MTKKAIETVKFNNVKCTLSAQEFNALIDELKGWERTDIIRYSEIAEIVPTTTIEFYVSKNDVVCCNLALKLARQTLADWS